MSLQLCHCSLFHVLCGNCEVVLLPTTTKLCYNSGSGVLQTSLDFCGCNWYDEVFTHNIVYPETLPSAIFCLPLAVGKLF